MNWKKLVREIALIGIAGCALGFVVNHSLVKNYVQGAYKRSFLPAERYASITFISLAEAEDLFHKREAVFLDSRSAKEFAAGHVPGALSLPFDEVKKRFPAGETVLPKDRPLVVYCHGGDCNQSTALARILHDKGWRNLKICQGGWDQWKRSGLPVEEGRGQK